MTDDDPKTKKAQPAAEHGASSALTPETIQRLLRESVVGAHELDEKLKRVFELSQANALVRLK